MHFHKRVPLGFWGGRHVRRTVFHQIWHAKDNAHCNQAHENHGILENAEYGNYIPKKKKATPVSPS
jgi:hypothetical protein